MATGPGYHDGWVLARGVRTHYWWAGTEGPPVVLFHGSGPGTSGESGFRFMLPALAAAGYRAIAPDQISMGWTDTRPHVWPIYGHQSLVDHVRDVIEALCLDEVAVAGNSQGVYVAAKYALDHPEKVTKAFFMGSGSIAQAMGVEYPPTPGLLELRKYDFTVEGMRRLLTAIANAESLLTNEEIRARHAGSILPGIRESRAAFDAYRARMAKEPKLFARFLLKDSLPSLAIPAHFVWGQDDRFAPVSAAHQLETLLPNIPFEYVPGGHQIQNEAPDVVNKMIIEFLAK